MQTMWSLIRLFPFSLDRVFLYTGTERPHGHDQASMLKVVTDRQIEKVNKQTFSRENTGKLVPTYFSPFTKIVISLVIFIKCACTDQEGGQGVRTPLANYKILGFLAILVGIHLKSQSYQSSIQCWAIIAPPAKRHLNGALLAGY